MGLTKQYIFSALADITPCWKINQMSPPPPAPIQRGEAPEGVDFSLSPFPLWAILGWKGSQGFNVAILAVAFRRNAPH
jgi:hypothetical protein